MAYPVLVFTKSALASLARRQAMTFSASVRSAVSMITLLMAPLSWQASLTAATSARTRSLRPDLSAPMLMTMSISRAPSRMTRRASWALISDSVAPNGKPMTEATATPGALEARRAARDTQTGLMHTDANPWRTASAQSLSMSAAVASGFSSVWSMYWARPWGTLPASPLYPMRDAPVPTISWTFGAQRAAQPPVQAAQFPVAEPSAPGPGPPKPPGAVSEAITWRVIASMSWARSSGGAVIAWGPLRWSGTAARCG